MSIEPLFTSAAGGSVLRARIVQLIAEAADLSVGHRVDLNIMTFSFTDPQIADALIAAAQRRCLHIRLIADWTQRGEDGHQQLSRLARLGLPNLEVRYKKDQPYIWHAEHAQLQWSYLVSRGLLHHKTLSVIVDGEPWRLGCGSYNWTAKSARSYENLVVVSDSTPELVALMARMELEFEALWSDGRASLNPDDAETHYRAIAAEYRENPLAEPGLITGLEQGSAVALRVLNSHHYLDQALSSGRTVIAFSARIPDEHRSFAGYAELNRRRTLTIGATARRVPLTIATLALDFILRARAGETLRVAMHGLSPRVPEYGALLDAARRGVHVRILLDGKVGGRTIARLSEALEREVLAIDVRTGSRMMHQKYIVNADSGAVLTGTANMSTDAIGRHSEQRLRFLGNDWLAGRFAADFDTIWNRISEGRDEAEKELGEQTPPETDAETRLI